MLKVSFKKYSLQFITPAVTSRGSMHTKNGYFITINDGAKQGIGECSFIEGLSIDDLQNYETALHELCLAVEIGDTDLLPSIAQFPSIHFGLECALLDYKNGGRKILFESDFTAGKSKIDINGLVWMGSKENMMEQIEQKLARGFKCIKLKVGAIDFEDEKSLLAHIRSKYSKDVIELRLDANGAFNASDVIEKLDTLSKFDIHSIEQPVKQGQWELMQKVCQTSTIPVALDEELIGLKKEQQDQLLDYIKPAYIILKPSLLGGFKVCDSWIEKAALKNIGWWATSALESNIGLNAVAQWVFTKKNELPQGLGTGSLYANNISSPLYISKGQLGYDVAKNWGSV